MCIFGYQQKGETSSYTVVSFSLLYMHWFGQQDVRCAKNAARTNIFGIIRLTNWLFMALLHGIWGQIVVLLDRGHSELQFGIGYMLLSTFAFV